MSKEIKVSVIIPVYNVEKYLKECLDSIISQTLNEIEILCINDGSTDGSLQILKEYAKKDNRINLIDKVNEGVAIARNLGINLASGEFICFIDPDDIYPSNDILETLYTNAVQNNVLICGGEFSSFTNEDKSLKQDYKDNYSGYLFSQDRLIKYKDYQYDYGYHRFIYNREFLINNNIFFPLYKRFQDVPFFINAMISAKEFYALHKITYAYRKGHCFVNWTPEKVNHFLQGITDNLNNAKNNNLEKLSMYTAIRFKEHYKGIKNSMDLKSFQLINSIREISPEIDSFCKQNHISIYGVYFRQFVNSCFSIKNSFDRTHKIITLFGLKIKLKRSCKNA